eukprot:scaffold7458_cov60-Attheya_sp.AAC.5
MSTPSGEANKKQKTDDGTRKLFLELVQEPERAVECLTDLHQRLAAVDTKSATEAIDTANRKSNAMRKRNEILFSTGWDLVIYGGKKVGYVVFDSDSKGNITLDEFEIDEILMSEFSSPSCPDHKKILEFEAEHRFYGERVPCLFGVQFPEDDGESLTAYYSPQISMEQMEAGLADPYDDILLVAREED